MGQAHQSNAMPSNRSDMTISEDSMLMESHYIASPLFDVRILSFQVTADDCTERRMRTESSRDSPWGTPLFISQDAAVQGLVHHHVRERPN